MLKNRILEHISNPKELERLFHESPEKFRYWLNEATIAEPDSETLKVWNARFSFEIQEETSQESSTLFQTIVLGLLAGTLIKLPSFLGVNSEWMYLRLGPSIVIGTLIGYFFLKDRQPYKSLVQLGCFLAIIVVATLLPDHQDSSSVVMSLIHVPLVGISILSLIYMGPSWKNTENRVFFIRYLGEIVMFSSLILLGGIALTLLTLGLFSLIGMSIEAWYIEYVVVYGIVAAPVVATYLFDSVLKRQSRLAIMIANAFAPLFLLTAIFYLVAMFWQGNSPFTDREFLIIFNGLLLLVWGIAVFSISGKNASSSTSIVDIVNLALVAITLVINSVALSAIAFRLSEYGISPNRVVVTGANLLMFTHMFLILIRYIGLVRKTNDAARLKEAVANYLPAYTAWSLVVVLILPIVFSFK